MLKIVLNFALSLLLFYAASTAANAEGRDCDQFQTAVSTTPVIGQTPAKLKAAFEAGLVDESVSMLIVGDSLAVNWQKTGPTDFANETVAVYGVRGERTQEFLWRLEHRPPTASPKLVVLILGTNNLSDRTAEPCSVTAGVVASVQAISRKWPSAEIIVMPILPRGPDFAFRDGERQRVNSALRDAFAGSQLIRVANIDENRLTCGRSSAPCPNYRKDLLHITDSGYSVLADGVSQSRRSN